MDSSISRQAEGCISTAVKRAPVLPFTSIDKMPVPAPRSRQLSPRLGLAKLASSTASLPYVKPALSTTMDRPLS